MKCASKHIHDTAKRATVEETSKVQAAAAQRLGEMLCGMFSAKHIIEVVETVRKPETMTEALKAGLEATGLLLVEANSMGTLRMNVGLNMHPAPRNFDEELDRLAEKYGTEYIAEQLLKHTSSLANIKTARAEAECEREREREHGSHSRQEPVIGKHSVSYVELHGVEAATNIKASAPTEDLDTSEPTLPEAYVVDVLQRFLLAGKYFSPEIGASPTLELAIADAITYIKELMDLCKVQGGQDGQEDDLK